MTVESVSLWNVPNLLIILQAIECIDQLVYVSHTDNSRIVKVKAKEALLSFGE